MQAIVEQLPEAASKVSSATERMRIGQPGNMQKIQNAAAKVEKAATEAGSSPASRQLPPTSSSTGLHSGSAASCGTVR